MEAHTKRSAEPGLRERKKAQTRQLIAETARRLFTEHGFEGVTVAEVARQADVSEKTVFNYFPTKEDLFYSGLEAFEAELVNAIRDREPGVTVLEAFRAFLLRPRGLFALDPSRDDRVATERLRNVTRVITESPALLARERQIFARYTETLAELIAAEAETRAEAAEPRAVAAALIGVHAALITYVRRRVLAGAGAADLARDYRSQLELTLALLERGLGDYLPRKEA
jgi:AcrR family transcriptional regulator